jgi:hypothetical protein
VNPLALLALLVPVAAGFGVGCIPVLNEHLHWNIWVVVPISGLFVGAGLAWLQFWTLALLGIPLTRALRIAACASVVVGYFATNFGAYYTTTIVVHDVQGLPDGNYTLSQLLPLGTYLKVLFGESTIGRGSATLQYGAAATTVSALVDLAGAGLAGFGMLRSLAFLHPLCSGCRRLKKLVRKFGIRPPSRKESVQELFQTIRAHCEDGNHPALMKFLYGLARAEQNAKSALRISVHERVCAGCREASTIGRVFRKNERGQWAEMSEHAFALTRSAEAGAAPDPAA